MISSCVLPMFFEFQANNSEVAAAATVQSRKSGSSGLRTWNVECSFPSREACAVQLELYPSLNHVAVGALKYGKRPDNVQLRASYRCIAASLPLSCKKMMTCCELGPTGTRALCPEIAHFGRLSFCARTIGKLGKGAIVNGSMTLHSCDFSGIWPDNPKFRPTSPFLTLAKGRLVYRTWDGN
jgi:hypothetical protein